MARVTTKTAEVKYVLEMSKREAEALTEVLLHVNGVPGEGCLLDDIYAALCEAGCESNALSSEIDDDQIIVTRDE